MCDSKDLSIEIVKNSYSGGYVNGFISGNAKIRIRSRIYPREIKLQIRAGMDNNLVDSVNIYEKVLNCNNIEEIFVVDFRCMRRDGSKIWLICYENNVAIGFVQAYISVDTTLCSILLESEHERYMRLRYCNDQFVDDDEEIVNKMKILGGHNVVYVKDSLMIISMDVNVYSRSLQNCNLRLMIKTLIDGQECVVWNNVVVCNAKIVTIRCEFRLAEFYNNPVVICLYREGNLVCDEVLYIFTSDGVGMLESFESKRRRAWGIYRPITEDYFTL